MDKSIQKEYVDNMLSVVASDADVIGVAAGGSWISGEIDVFSDVDLIVFTAEPISGNKSKMLHFAGRFGTLLTAFTGEHVGEPRLLICLYDNPLLHVDLKFLTLPEFETRVEDPVVLLDKTNALSKMMQATKAQWPYPDYQWLEDRFWIWVHYAAQKMGRGEYFETLDFLSYLRSTVLAPLLQVKNKVLPRGVRKLEQTINPEDQLSLRNTIAPYDAGAIATALYHCIHLYKLLRSELYPQTIWLHTAAEAKSMAYLDKIMAIKKV